MEENVDDALKLLADIFIWKIRKPKMLPLSTENKTKQNCNYHRESQNP